jgi:serine/threonine protein kinase
MLFMHRQNIVHGDIKPENLLVDSNGRVKICDFSVSRSFEVWRLLSLMCHVTSNFMSI